MEYPVAMNESETLKFRVGTCIRRLTNFEIERLSNFAFLSKRQATRFASGSQGPRPGCSQNMSDACRSTCDTETISIWV